ncbi:MAG: nucleotidyl transferase AbiEii/AbiGii toxin family protein [Bacteroidales bacterium]|nr:nucleotidyl transferase AbiEii/AbiGii toxin family protein [Bacteroidales bacterium]
MLQYQAVTPETLDILKKLMGAGFLKEFILVGGTSLALQIGHRKSYDLDLFTRDKFDPKILAAEINRLMDTVITGEAENTLNCVINGIPVDFIRYDYKLIGDTVHSDNIRLASKEDIACMKLSAIASRGSKKDFYDMHFLLRDFSLEVMFGFYERKYKSNERFHLIKSLIYFSDAEKEPDPITFIPMEWNEVKKTIQETVRLLIEKA